MTGSSRDALALLLAAATPACAATTPGDNAFDSGTTPEESESTSTTGPDEETSGGTADPPKLDVAGDEGGSNDACSVPDGDDDAPGSCSAQAPPESFDATIQWTWPGLEDGDYSAVTPLVANLSDDDDNGTIDLCDDPDILVVTYGWETRLNILDGATGAVVYAYEADVDRWVTPAIGDLDADGTPEIVTAKGIVGPPVAYAPDGTLLWEGDADWPRAFGGSIGLADLDNDGSPEIYAGARVYSAQGKLLWAGEDPPMNATASTAADLDDDGDLELVVGHAAYHHDGTPYYVNHSDYRGYPQVGDLDADGRPEVLVTGHHGITVLDAQGNILVDRARPTGQAAAGNTWVRPATIHDFDGDGRAEFALSSGALYSVYRLHDGVVDIHWSADVDDQTGIAAGTAFDFLGDASAEAMYADEHEMFVFDDAGQPLLQIPRASQTLSEYPVVADVDDDGSAEIVVVSNEFAGEETPPVQVIADAEDRWIQARASGISTRIT